MVDASADSPRAEAPGPRFVGVIGGGTAGYLTALALRRQDPSRAVTIVASKDIPVIGVGEATTTLMPPFLHGTLGLDPVELFAAVRPTFKLGIRFEWGQPPPHLFTYPFGDADPIEAFAFDGHLRDQSLVSMLMMAGAGPVLRGPKGELASLLPKAKFAYHLDNAALLGFLAGQAEAAGIERVEATVAEVETGAAGVEALHTKDGRRLRFDLYVDATGFGARLIGALKTRFLSYDSSLLCDRAAVTTIANPKGAIAPYTTAETLDAGWCWDIPVRSERHRGYVFCSQMIDDEAAVEELRRREPDMGEPWFVSFRSGRRDRFWAQNVVAMGNAYGFVEPLESTALHMVIVQIGYLLAGLEAQAKGDASYPEFASETVGRHWDYLRWFLALHYRFNHRRDTAFWRRARSEVEIGALAPVVERYRQRGPFLDTAGLPNPAHDPAFGFSGVMMMLLGQGLATPAPETVIDEARWRERTRRQRAVVKWALPQRAALEALDDQAGLLEALTGPGSWCMTEAERVELGGREELGPKSGHSSSRSPHDRLLESLR